MSVLWPAQNLQCALTIKVTLTNKSCSFMCNVAPNLIQPETLKSLLPQPNCLMLYALLFHLSLSVHHLWVHLAWWEWPSLISNLKQHGCCLCAVICILFLTLLSGASRQQRGVVCTYENRMTCFRNNCLINSGAMQLPVDAIISASSLSLDPLEFS